MFGIVLNCLLSLGVPSFVLPFVAECWDAGDDKSFFYGLRLKPILIIGVFALFGIAFLTNPLMAEYSNKEAEEHFQNGMKYIKKGYPDLAVKELEEAVRLEPGVIDGRRYLAVAYSLKMSLKKAVKEYETMFKLNPEVLEVPAIKAAWLEENKEVLENLERELKQFHLERPQKPMIHVLLGWLYGEEGRLKEAHGELLHALEKDPALDKESVSKEDKMVASLMVELVTAMQSSPTQAKTQLELLLFTLAR